MAWFYGDHLFGEWENPGGCRRSKNLNRQYSHIDSLQIHLIILPDNFHVPASGGVPGLGFYIINPET
jgi:hypothetical protein